MTTEDDDRDDAEQVTGYQPSLADVVRRWRYTLSPTLYTDEDSDVNDLLWQHVLEQRAQRGWLVLVVLLLLAQLAATTVLVLLASGALTR